MVAVHDRDRAEDPELVDRHDRQLRIGDVLEHPPDVGGGKVADHVTRSPPDRSDEPP